MRNFFMCGVLILLMSVSGASAREKKIMGDYKGSATIAGKKQPIAAQVVDRGNGNFQILLKSKLYAKDSKTLAQGKGKKQGAKAIASGKGREGAFAETSWEGTVDGREFKGKVSGKRSGSFAMERFVLASPTAGMKPPEGAIVLFKDSKLNKWEHTNGREASWPISNCVATVGQGHIQSKRKFKSCRLHVEFMLPYDEKRNRPYGGNSGVYIQKRYEIQILNSYGRRSSGGGCGAIYRRTPADINACAPPLQWQTYDIEFHMPKFDEQGKKTKLMRITVDHNGIRIHDDVDVKGPTGQGNSMGGDPATPNSLLLQDHGSPVRYRNVWLVPLED